MPFPLKHFFSLRFLLGAYLSCAVLVCAAADASLTREGISISISARTPIQTRAFYSARGLPVAAVDEIARSCFLTVGVRNQRQETVWLDLTQWQFEDAAGKVLKRLQQEDWRRRWTALQLPLAAQATFGWTQMPELRDLQADESVGGNIPLVLSTTAFSLRARFALGERASARVVELVLPNLRCADDSPGGVSQ